MRQFLDGRPSRIRVMIYAFTMMERKSRMTEMVLKTVMIVSSLQKTQGAAQLVRPCSLIVVIPVPPVSAAASAAFRTAVQIGLPAVGLLHEFFQLILEGL